jgi:hypothetical protein
MYLGGARGWGQGEGGEAEQMLKGVGLEGLHRKEPRKIRVLACGAGAFGPVAAG